MGRTSSHPDGSRREAVRLVLEGGRPVAKVAAELTLSPTTLADRVRAERLNAARAGAPGALAESEREALRHLRKQVKELTLEREILRSAAAHFARETSR